MSKSKLEMFDCGFLKLSDDLVLNIINKLEDDPRNWARLACVSTRFSSLIHNVCCQIKCIQTIPAVLSDLLSTTTATASNPVPPGGWGSMYKLAVCCPGLVLSGVLLEHLDFGLERELGPEEEFNREITQSGRADSLASSSSNIESNVTTTSDCCWSLYDDLLYDTLYDDSESSEAPIYVPPDGALDNNLSIAQSVTYDQNSDNDFISECKKEKLCKSVKSHLASGVWNLSREEGNKLLASRFKEDCLYICDWPGCVHLEEKRNYMLFRGIFKNFKQSRVWRTINDGKRKMIDLNCAFCDAKETWDLHAGFCLRSHFGFHDDGEPVVRAYVCENGHVSGAWTD